MLRSIWSNPLAWVGAGCLLTTLLLWPRVERSAAEHAALDQGRTIITFWDRHSGHEHDSRNALIDEFNASQDTIFVRSVAIGYNSTMEKILTATAGGAPPDICSIDSSLVAQLAPQGVFLAIDDLMDETPSLAQSEIYPHVWNLIHFDGHTWGVPLVTDTYCLVWNKAAFRRAGLDPERPPQTIEELEEYAAKLTVRAPNGTIEQMGFLPWLPWDLSHMWGALFGAEWYDHATDRVALVGQPAVVEAFRWQQSFTIDPAAAVQKAYAMSPERVAAFSKGIGEYFSANNPFYSGKVAMITEGEWQVTFIPKYAPGLEWGVAPIPQPAGAADRGYSPTVIMDTIPATARYPEEAKAFLAWFCSPRADGRPSPNSDFAYAIHNIPARRAEAAEARFQDNPRFKVYVDRLEAPEVVTMPVMPVAQYMMDQLERQRERVVYREVTPEQAVQEIEATTNRELARARALQARFRPVLQEVEALQ